MPPFRFVVIPRKRALFTLAVTAIAAAAAAWFLPGKSVDRSALLLFTGTPPSSSAQVGGRGSHAAPWLLVAGPNPKNTSTPVIVSLGDDREGLFQSHPPSPLDFAVLLKNFPRLGPDRIAVGTPLSWESPDPLGLVALEKVLASYAAVVTTSPLSRGATGAALPPSYQRASVPVSTLQGDFSLLPIVNRQPLPGIVLGGNNALSGFQTIDFENHEDRAQLIARWNDRAVFSFFVVAAMIERGLTVADLTVVCGSHIELGKNGPAIPLDSFGRYAGNLPPVPAAVLPAAQLLDPTAPPEKNSEAQLVVLRDDRSTAPPAARTFSARLIPALVRLAESPPAKPFRRLAVKTELGLLAGLCLLLAGISLFRSRLYFVLLGGLVLGAGLVPFLGISRGIWLPVWSIFAAVISAAMVRFFFPSPASQNPALPSAPPNS